MYKKNFSIFILSLCSSLFIKAQNGKVGINTNTPQETLEVNGTIRISELPASGGKIYGSPTATTRNTNFTPTQMVVANQNGVLGIQNFPNIPTIPTSSTSVILSNNNQYQRAALTGDVTADENNNNTTVSRIQGRNISNTAPTNGQVLKWNSTTNAWTPTDDKRIIYEEVLINSNLSLSSTAPEDLKDLYIIDRNSTITLPTCNGDYDGRTISFYKWGGAEVTNNRDILTFQGNIYNFFGTGGFAASNFPGMTYTGGNSPNLKIDLSTSNLHQYGFRTYKFMCLKNNWFLDFGTR